MRIITQFKPNMSFKDYYKSMKPGDAFMFKHNCMIYMVTHDFVHGTKSFVTEYGGISNPSYYFEQELRLIVRRNGEDAATVYSALEEKYAGGMTND